MSWRVALLHSLDQEALFKEFRLTEAWDSEHNKKLIPKMPKVYAPQGKAEAGLTPYRAFVGKGTNMFSGPESTIGPAGRLRYTRFGALSERWDRTALAAESSDMVVWTQPDELEVEEDGPEVGRPVRGGCESPDGGLS